MTLFRLLLRSLRYFLKADLAVAAGAAVAVAVLAGALMVGDSVQASLRQLAVQRLGPVDFALTARGFVDETLADRLAAQPGFTGQFERCVTGLAVRGGATVPVEDPQARAVHVADVQVFALSDWQTVQPGRCVLNGRLADELRVAVGDRIILNLPKMADLPVDAVLARRKRSEIRDGLPVTVERIERGESMAALFSLTPSQRTPRNAWVNLAELQQATGQPGRANLLLVAGRDGAAVEPLNSMLAQAADFQDVGLGVSRTAGGPGARDRLTIQSRTSYLSPQAEQALWKAAESTGVRPLAVTVNLAARIERLAAGDRPAKAIHYVVIAGVGAVDGRPVGADQIVLNQWANDRLDAQPGDRIRFRYYRRRPDGRLEQLWNDGSPGPSSSDRSTLSATTQSHGPPASQPEVGVAFIVGPPAPMEGMGADPTLTPSFGGLTELMVKERWQDLPAELEIDADLVTDEDENYFKSHQAAPKAFVALETARRLWGGQPFGDLTSVRIEDEAGRLDAFAAEFKRLLPPLEFRPIRAEQLAAASGSTDFSGLFLGFSFFLIGSAVLLVGLLFRLGVEQRARQLGLMGAVGFGRWRLVGLCLAEGLVLATVGGVAGLAGAVGYTRMMMAGLTHWWLAAVGTTALRLEVSAGSLAVGLAGGVAVAALAVLWSAWWVGRQRSALLLSGQWRLSAISRRATGRWARRAAAALFAVSAGLIGLAFAGRLREETAFLASGATLLAAMLAGLAGWWRRGPIRTGRLTGWAPAALMRLGVRNAARNPARSVLTVGLLAFAAFSLVTVAAMRTGRPDDTHNRRSGAGGFALVVIADIPLTGDLNTAAGREVLGIRDGDAQAWSKAKFIPLRRRHGQDVSCLNMTRPDDPTILGVPAEMVQRGGFRFARALGRTSNPWSLLDGPADDAIPVIADDATARYILRLGLGRTMTVRDQSGLEKTVRLVATLADSIFQGELLMSQANFGRLYGSLGGAGLVLVEADRRDADEVADLLAGKLEPFAVSVERTSDRLAGYARIANTYLSTFEALGGLGLLLGTAGLAVVLLRSLAERRGEMAVLAAMGYSRRRRLALLVAENGWLLALGLAGGAATALLGALPAVVSRGRQINLGQLAVTLGAVAATGLGLLCVAALIGGRRFGPADLRRE